MNRKNSIKTKRTVFLTTLLLILTAPIFLTTFSIISDNQEKPINMPTDIPVSMSQGIGEDVWWDKSFQWRKCINITNPGTYNLTNNIIKVSFNWNDLYTSGHLQQDLDDIRIVENGELKNYYIKKDYPTTNIATVWFETNSTADTSDYDTYMYYGNDTIGRATSYYMENCPDGIAHWDFDNDPLGEVTDTANYLYNGTLQGGLDENSYITGKYGKGIEIDLDASGPERIPLNMCLYTGSASVPSGYEANSLKGPFYEFTASAWVKLDLDNGGWSILDFDRSEFFNLPAGSPGYTANAGEGEFGSTAYNGDTEDMSGVSRVDNGQWTHILIRYDSSETNEKKIYVNGSLDAALNQYNLNEGIGRNNQIRFGYIGVGSEASSYDSSNNGGSYRDGIMRVDDVRIFDYSLSNNEIEWFANYYDLEVELLTEVERSATASFIIKDYDGLRVENAEVALWNGTKILNITDIGEFRAYTDSQGETEFTKVPFGSYNVTVNYTLSSEAGTFEEIVYDSRLIDDGEVNFQGLFITETLYTNLWTIDFEVDDYDGNPLNYGYINVSAEGNSQVLEKIELDPNGEAKFVWLSDKDYYNYSVYYYNPDYYISSTYLNSSSIYRNLKTERYLLNETATSSPPDYEVKRSEFMPNSTLGYSGDNRIVEVRLSCEKMDDNLTSIFMNYYYNTETEPTTVDSTFYDTETSANLTYYPYEDSDNIYGIQFEINGQNTTVSNGTISLNLTYTYNQKIQTNISTLSIRVLDSTGTEPVSGLKVKVLKNATSQQIVELTTDTSGYAYGSYTNDFGFRYLTEWTYNFSLWVVTERQTFKVNVSDQPKPPGITDYYNYTLQGQSNLVFNLDLDFTERIANFTNRIGPSSVIWGENMSFSVIYETSDNGGSTWRTDYNRNGSLTSATWTIYSQFGEKLLELPMERVDEISTNSGNFSLEINSSQFSAGGNGKNYYVYISGQKNFWRDPSPAFFGFTIEPIDTDIELYNYTTMEKLSSNQISKRYGDIVNITLRYFTSDENINLTAESINYEWDYGGPITIDKDPLNPDFYTFSVDLSTIPNIGTYRIDVNAQRENYSSVSDYAIFLNVLERKTIINGTDSLLPISKNYYALNEHYIYFEYNDTYTGRLSDLDTKSYTWYSLAEDGSPMSGPGNEGNGDLNVTMEDIYFLDFDTESRAVGKYQIFITFTKNNYETRNSIINLEIKNRLTSSSLSIGVSDTIALGEAKNYTITYIDIETSLAITDGIGNYNYSYTGPESGIGNLIYNPIAGNYTLDIDTAGLTNGTYTVDITLNKLNYEEQIKSFTLIVNRIQENYTTQFTAISTTPLTVEWGQNIQINFTFQNSSDTGQNWENTTPDALNLRFYDLSDSQIGDPISLLGYSTGVGTYSFSFNTSQYSFIGGNSYYLEISASLIDYNPPDNLRKSFTIITVPTNLQILNYTTKVEFSSDQTTVFWNQQFNLTLYYETSLSEPLLGASITYDWAYGTGQISSDPLYGFGYYTFLFNSGNATNIGSYNIEFSATKENYSTQTPTFTIIIINRPTILNGTSGVFVDSKQFYVKEAINFTFEYRDVLSGTLVDGAQEFDYTLEKLDANDQVIWTKTGVLFEVGNNYILDLNTEDLTDGNYRIALSLNKDNYEGKTSIIFLTVNKRVFYHTPIPTSLRIDSGGSVNLNITLTDPNNNSAYIQNAKVYIINNNQRYNFTESEDGTYSLTINKISSPFFVPEFYTPKIYIEKANFTTIEIQMRIEVKMAEIFPGFPTFYFMMIMIGVIAVVGALATYRYIQIARIPEFVKRARSMKKEIKGDKSISDKNLYPSKEEYITEIYGEDWEKLGLSLEEKLGLHGKNTKKLNKSNDGGVY